VAAFDILNSITIDGNLWTLSSNLWTEFAIQLLGPPTLLCHFTLGFLLGKLLRRPLKINMILNSLGLVVKGVFITIASMPLQMFVTERMPSGQLMVRTFPDVQVGSPQWIHAVPVAVVAFVAYCITFIAYVAYAVVRAPRWAAEWPDCMVRYDFAFGDFRPDRWWFCLVELCYAVCFMLVQVATPSLYLRIYVWTILVEGYVFLCFRLQPYIFIKSNKVQQGLQACLLLFLIISTSFVNAETMSADELQRIRDSYGVLALVVMCCGMLYAVQGFLAWLMAYMAPALAGDLLETKVNVYKLALEFRDMAHQICYLSDEAFMNSVEALSEVDQLRLKEVLRTMVPIFLKLQPGRRLLHQRPMPGVPFEVWDRHAVTLAGLRSIVTDEAHQIGLKRAEARVALMLLADDFREKRLLRDSSSVTISESVKNVASRSSEMTSKMRRERGLFPSRSSAGPLKMKDFPENANKEQFVELVRQHTDLPDDDLKEVFELIDYSSDGQISPLELTVALRAGAPRLSERHLEELRAIHTSMLEKRPKVRSGGGEDSNSSSPSLPSSSPSPSPPPLSSSGSVAKPSQFSGLAKTV